jgi:hypothetical protein
MEPTVSIQCLVLASAAESINRICVSHAYILTVYVPKGILLTEKSLMYRGGNNPGVTFSLTDPFKIQTSVTDEVAN